MSSTQEEKEYNEKLIKYESEHEIRDANKPMGFLGGSAFIFGSIMGTGIFISVSDTFKVFSSDNILVVILVWMLGGLVSMIGSLCYAELGSRFPKTGGECVYYKEIIGKRWSVLFVIMFVFVVKTISLAAFALTAAKYLTGTFKICETMDPDVATKIFGITFLCKIQYPLFLVLTFIFNCFNKKVIMKCIIAFSFIKLFTLIVLISIGVYSLIRGNVSDWKSISKFEDFDLMKLSSAFVGELTISELSNLLLSSVIGVSAITITYILTAISYSSVLGYAQVRISQTVALSFAKLTLGGFYPIISIMIFLSALGSAVSNLYTCGGVATYAGIEGILPSLFSLVHKNSRIPLVSILSMTFISSCFVFIRFETLLNYCIFVTWAFYFLTFTCLCIMKCQTTTDSRAEK
ncbi:hypothetical protein MXB_4913, partial [Myxobolus squamalis]